MFRFLSFPPETITVILSYLPGPSLAACHLICHKIRNVILCSPLLQYNQALKVSNLLDNPFSPFTPQEKLNLLRKREKAWAFAELVSTKRFPLDPPGRYYSGRKYLADGLFVIGEEKRTKLSVASLLGEQAELKWRTIGTSGEIIWSGCNVFEHDLIAVLSLSPSPNATLSLLQLSTGGAHPRASLPVIPLPIPNPSSAAGSRYWIHAQIEIVANHLVILQVLCQGTSTAVRKLYIYDWLIGSLKGEWNPEGPFGGFAFLDEDLLLLPRQTALDIHSIQDVIEGVLEPRCSLLLPQPVRERALDCLVSPNPTVAIHTLQHDCPFRSNPQNAIICLRMPVLGPRGIEVAFFVHRNVLIDICSSGSKFVSIPWSEWGPENTSWLTSISGEYFCAGERVLCKPRAESAYTVLDFNAHRVAKMQRWLDQAEGQVYGDDDVGSSDLERLKNRLHRTWTSQGTGVDVPNLFVEEVRGNLPYAACSSSESFAWDELFMDDERVVSVTTNRSLTYRWDALRDPPLLEVHSP